MTEMTNLNLRKKGTSVSRQAVRWDASSYHDMSRPSVLFRLVAMACVLTWIVITGWLVATTTIVGSPDEAANRLFITHLAETGQYRIDTGVSPDALSFLHPRSIAVQGSYLASGSFLGLVQAGALVYQLFGAGAERMLTPLLSLVGLVAMYFVFRRFWSRWWSLLGVVLMAFHPAFFEFATLPYLHNGAVVAGLMVAGWALLRLLERPTMWAAVLSGSTLGLALYFRPVEALWVVPAVTIVLVARKLWVVLLIVGTMTIVMQLPWLLANQSVYGSFLSSGYTPSGVFVDGEGAAAIAQPAKILFTPPGGAWTWHWLSSVWWYFVLFLPSWSFMGAIALARYFKRKYVTWSKALKLSTLFLIGLFPLVYYGTWNLYPTTPASVNGALASYVRYWVPLYLMMVPGVIIVLRLLSRRWLVMMGVVVMLGTQALTIWTHPVAGLAARRAANTKYQVIRDRLLSMTEANAVVFAGAADKYIQGDRLAAFRLPSTDDEWVTVQRLMQQRPVYFYAPHAAYDMDVVTQQATEHAVRLVQRGAIGRDALYLFQPL